MNNYAIIKKGTVANVIVADSIEAVSFFFEGETIIAVTEATGQPAIGFDYDSKAGKFVPACYYKGWMFDKNSWTWQAPTPYPQDGKLYEWENEAEAWIEFTLPEAKELPIGN